ncbi:MAG: hypothetical protein KW788_01440 [Candidatus Doudnabacteria bacterium]|nr:hypothetical protein [Candidatus Doudnabacteria bacterium]
MKRGVKDDIISDPVSLIGVENVAEEYDIVRKTSCNCGGSYKFVRQELQKTDDGSNRLLDVLFVKCGVCEKPREFRFDASKALENVTKRIANDPAFQETLKKAKEKAGLKE